MTERSIVETVPARPARAGFSLRIGGGIGYGSAHGDLGAGHMALGGLNGAISLDFGAATSRRLVVYGRVGGFAFNRASASDSTNSGSAYFGLLGPGARYYFTPDDWYANGTAALAVVTASDSRSHGQDVKAGLGVELEVGKDWWSGQEGSPWGVGLGARFSYVSCALTGSAKDAWEGAALSLVLSVSYN